MANPFVIQSPSYGGGLAALGAGLGQLGRQYRQESMQEDALARQQQAEEMRAAKLQQARDLFASGASPQEVAMFSLENPEIGKTLMGSMQFRDEASKQNLMDTYQSIVSGGDVERALTSRAKYLQGQGIDNTDTLDEIEQYRANPESYIEQKKNQYALLDKDYAERLARQTPEAMTEYQALMIGNKKVDQILKAEEMKIKREEMKLKRETDNLKRQQLEDSITSKRRNIEKTKMDAIQQAEDAISTNDRSIDTLTRLISHPGLESASGFQSNFPTLGGTAASDFEQTLETFQSQSFLNAVKQMKGMGALSENEGKKLAASIGALSTKMSDAALKKELQRIKETLEVAKVKMQNRMPGGYKKATKGEISQERITPQTEPVSDQPATPPEGTIIRNKTTGETMIMRGGQFVPQKEADDRATPTYRGY